MANEVKEEGYVKSEKQQGVTTIEFFHPRSNSLPGRLLEELTRQVSEAGHDAATRVIVLRSAGEKAFCAGASFDELLAIQNEKQGFSFFSGFAHLINAMRKCPQFIIVRIQGKCVGGGLGLAAAADHAIAVEGADIRLSELAVGIGPFVVGPAVERKIGLSAFGTLAIDAEMWRSDVWAREKGLYAELHHEVKGMDESVRRLADSLSRSNPEAMAEMKKNFWEGTGHWDELLLERAAVSGRLVLSEFSREAIKQFKKGG
jgi:methylglutaconyl-CoA hydratase